MSNINPPNIYTPLLSTNFIPLFDSLEQSSEEEENDNLFSFTPLSTITSKLYPLKKYKLKNKNIKKNIKFVEKCRKIKKIII
tara:strand:+ start:371 stop:616 length:246 start_codon:yes stop_codon:yes gene_type:complete